MREKKMRHKIAGVENAGKVVCVIKLNQHKVNDKRSTNTHIKTRNIVIVNQHTSNNVSE